MTRRRPSPAETRADRRDDRIATRDVADVAAAERLVGGLLRDPADIWLGTSPEALRGPRGAIDPARVAAAVAALIAARPGLRPRRTRHTPATNGGHPMTDTTPQPTPEPAAETGGHFSWHQDEILTKPSTPDVDPVEMALADARLTRAAPPAGDVVGEAAGRAADSLVRIADEIATELTNWQRIEAVRPLSDDEVMQRNLDAGALDVHASETVRKAARLARAFDEVAAEAVVPPMPDAATQALCRSDLEGALASGGVDSFELVTTWSPAHLATAASAWGTDKLAGHLDGGGPAALTARRGILEGHLERSTDPKVIAVRRAAQDIFRRHSSAQLALMGRVAALKMGASRATGTAERTGRRG